MDTSRFLAGNQKGKGPEGAEVPNITPDTETGTGKWTVEQIAEHLGTGNRPDGDTAGGLMERAIKGTSAGFKDLTLATASPSPATPRRSRPSRTRSASSRPGAAGR